MRLSDFTSSAGSMRSWQIDAAGVALCLGLAGVWYLAGVQPLSAARASREVLQGELNERELRAGELDDECLHKKGQAENLRQQIESGKVVLAPVDKLNGHIAELNGLAAGHNLRIDIVKPSQPVVLPRYTTVPIRISGSGSFADAARFLHALHEGHRDTGLVGMELHAEPEAPDKEPYFAFNLVWYAEPPAPPAKSPRK
jgi:Tfp pilus assembly protein PilO